MIVADYPHDTWLLDEGNDPQVRAMCDLLGVKHFSRSGVTCYNTERGRFLAKSKAGNHNAWYEQFAMKYDMVAQVDTDFKVRRDFLTRTIGHFNNQRDRVCRYAADIRQPRVIGLHAVRLSRPTCSTGRS